MEKYHINKNGDKRLCSGYGVYPDGEKCSGCMDCHGRFLHRNPTHQEIEEVFNRTHTTLQMNGNIINVVKPKRR